MADESADRSPKRNAAGRYESESRRLLLDDARVRITKSGLRFVGSAAMLKRTRDDPAAPEEVGMTVSIAAGGARARA